ncbi:hypothetical protein [Bradyrhizobium sp. CW11]|uniref:hypothetical protein n=1 Tax=Bradyrhizobium sp. CW11 TaxID=2782684 RepID=UPI001FFBBEEC|nr:hypothetical protein [Bradyrhizobium sp. CW11]MCK1346026.1 hypothetical protein [Bradyrhizobium sp. CW11]
MYKVSLDDRSWGLPRDFDPPKPLRAAQIARLGDALDEFEGAPPWRVARSDAQIDYLNAVRDRTWAKIRKLERLKSVPPFKDGPLMKAEITHAQCRLDRACTAREICDARAALELTQWRFEISQRRYREARRRAVAGERADKNIITLRGMAFRRDR